MIYLFCYTISICFVLLAKKAGNKTAFISFISISIFIPSLLAGLRGITIGTDTINYYNETWKNIQYGSDIKSFINQYISESRNTIPELFFGLLARGVFKLTGSYNIFMFICHSIIITCIYIGAFRLKKHAEPEIVIIFFYFLYLGQSLNITRQFVAMSIIFAFVADLEEKNYIRYILSVLLCIPIHNTAVLGLIPFFVFYFLHIGEKSIITNFIPIELTSKGKEHPYKRFILCFGLVFLVLNVITIVTVLVNVGILSRKYLWYITSAEATGSKNIVTIMFLAVEFFGLILFWKQIKKYNNEFDFYFVCSFTFVVLNSLGSVLHYGDRLSEYFAFLNLITIGSIEKCQRNAKEHFYAKMILCLVAFCYWSYVYVYRNSNYTMPYYIQIY